MENPPPILLSMSSCRTSLHHRSGGVLKTQLPRFRSITKSNWKYPYQIHWVYSGSFMNYSSPGFNIRAPSARQTREGLPTGKDVESKTKKNFISGLLQWRLLWLYRGILPWRGPLNTTCAGTKQKSRIRECKQGQDNFFTVALRAGKTPRWVFILVDGFPLP